MLAGRAETREPTCLKVQQEETACLGFCMWTTSGYTNSSHGRPQEGLRSFKIETDKSRSRTCVTDTPHLLVLPRSSGSPSEHRRHCPFSQVKHSAPHSKKIKHSVPH
eukprot:1141360-Pelagomonas_calceolata.AAC.2